MVFSNSWKYKSEYEKELIANSDNLSRKKDLFQAAYYQGDMEIARMQIQLLSFSVRIDSSRSWGRNRKNKINR